MSSTLNRRKLLSAAGFALALPLLPSLEPRRAQAAGGAPKRLVLWYQPDGDMEDKPYWFPKGSQDNFQLGQASAVLEPIKSDCIFLHGVHNGTPAGDCHSDYMPNMQTGGTRKDSIDQLIAAGLHSTAAFPSLEFGVATDREATNGGRLSFKGGVPLAPEADPNKMFLNIFRDRAGSQGTPAMADPQAMQRLKFLQQKRQSILDGVLVELTEVSQRVNPEDKQRLDSHASAVRDFEKTLTTLNGAMAESAPADCGTPKLDVSSLTGQSVWNGALDNQSVPNLDKIAQVQQDLLVLALRCDMTRVATFMYNRSLSSQTFEFLPIVNKSTISHMFAHTWRISPEMESDFVTLKKWRAGMFLKLVQALKAVPDGAGTLLDSTLLLWLCEMGLGSHAPTNIPFVLAGGGSTFRTGRFLDYAGTGGGEPHMKLYLSLAQALGVSLSEFGGATSGLSGLA
jgi:Protein of unknown function (DUF1552)